MLSDEKYIDVVGLIHSRVHEEHYVSGNNHPAIILKGKLGAVQMEKKKRGNVVRGEGMEIVGRIRSIAVKIENKK